MARTWSRGPGVLVTLRNADPRLASRVVGRSRSKYEARFHVADTSAPTRGVNGPLMNRFACAQVLSRTIAGGESERLPAFIAGADPVNSNVRSHDAAGFLGVTVTAIPGAPTSIGITPVAIATCSHASTPGISSGSPVRLGLVMSTSPTRKTVCVQVLPCAPTRDGAPDA